MKIKSKRNLAIATLAAVAVVGISSVAYALFATTETATATGGAENFESITVVGTQQGGALLPGEPANVSLALTNPNGNVKAKVTAITAEPVVVDPNSIDVPANAGGCAGYVVLDANNINNSALPTLAVNGSATYVLNNAVTFGDAPIECEGMTWTTKWKVAFQATR